MGKESKAPDWYKKEQVRKYEERGVPCLKLYFDPDTGDVLEVHRINRPGLYFGMMACAIVSAARAYFLPGYEDCPVELLTK